MVVSPAALRSLLALPFLSAAEKQEFLLGVSRIAADWSAPSRLDGAADETVPPGGVRSLDM